MKPATFTCYTEQDLSKPISYAKRCLKVAKHGVLVRVGQERLKRSTPQNKYYWGVVIKEMAEEHGCTDLEMHEILKSRHLIKDTIMYGGTEYTIYRSTTELDTAEFEEYLEKCRFDALQHLGILVRKPNETEFNY